MCGLCIPYILMDIKASYLIQKSVLRFIRFAVSRQNIFHAEKSRQPVIIHIIPEGIMIMICKEQFRITDFDKFLDISVHNRIIG